MSDYTAAATPFFNTIAPNLPLATSREALRQGANGPSGRLRFEFRCDPPRSDGRSFSTAWDIREMSD
jgi:hypothetical protein